MEVSYGSKSCTCTKVPSKIFHTMATGRSKINNSEPHVTLKTSTRARQRKSYSWSPTQHATSTSPRLRVLVRLTRVSGIPSWGCLLRVRITRRVVCSHLVTCFARMDRVQSYCNQIYAYSTVHVHYTMCRGCTVLRRYFSYFNICLTSTFVAC